METEAAMSAINWLAVLAAAVSTFLLGGLWYGPLFGTRWMRASGVTTEQMEGGGSARIFGLSFALQLLAAVVLAFFVAGTEPSFTVAAAAMVGAFWVAPALGVVYLFERRSLSHWAINAGYHVAAFTLMGVILAVWR